MLDFIKSAPWTCGIGALILVVAVIGVIVAIVKKGNWTDRGFLTTDDGKHLLQWTKVNLPVTALLHPELALSWGAAYKAAAARWNEVAPKRMLFDKSPQQPPMGYNLEGVVPAGFILIRPGDVVGDLQADHGRTKLNWRRDSGEIFGAVVEVPLDTSADRVYLMVHELGHVLGLDHDDDNLGSVMYGKMGGRINPGDVTGADADRIRKAYE